MYGRLAVGLALAAVAAISPALGQQKGEWLVDPNTGCKIWNNAPDPILSVKLKGNCPKGLLQGHGVVELFHSGSWFKNVEAEFVDGVVQDGPQVLTYATTGGRYVGNVVNGDFHGHGVYTSKAGDRFEGEFNHNKPNGNGTLKMANGTIYSGTWTNGCFKQGDKQFVLATTKEACGFK